MVAGFYGWFTEGFDTADSRTPRRCSPNSPLLLKTALSIYGHGPSRVQAAEKVLIRPRDFGRCGCEIHCV